MTMQFVEFTREWIRNVLKEWRSGQTLTKDYYLYGVDMIHPYPSTTYSKPILVLVNELCFSGGDFFPAILQDNNRVTVMGTRTAGAGGYVQPTQYPNRLGIQLFSVTGSIAHRLQKQPIENLGVTPDIPYALTAKDFTSGFSDYKAAILGAIDSIIK